MNRTMADMENDYSPFEGYTMFRSHLPYASNIEYALDRDAMENGSKHLLNRLRNNEFMAQPFKAIYNEGINSRNFQPRLF